MYYSLTLSVVNQSCWVNSTALPSFSDCTEEQRELRHGHVVRAVLAYPTVKSTPMPCVLSAF